MQDCLQVAQPLRRAAPGAIFIGALLCAVAPSVSAVEPVEARHIREIWLDEARQRHVNMRITVPERGTAESSAARPVLLFSTPQGFRWGGHSDHYLDLAEELVRRGVVMVTISHYDRSEPLEGDERFEDVYPGIRTGARDDPAVDRFEDGRFVLDRLEHIGGESREGWPPLDLERIAVAGHSAGTLTALHLSGMPVRNRDGRVFAARRDPRIRALVLFSHNLEYSGPSRADLREVGDVAGLHVAGSRDHPEYRNTPYRYIDGAPQYWLVANADHNVGAFGSDALVTQVTADFLATYLGVEPGARARLRRDVLLEHGEALVSFSGRFPSWRPRWDQRDFVAWAREFLPWGVWLHDRAIAHGRALGSRAP